MRRSGAKIMAALGVLLGSLSYIMILAVINGTLGYLCAMGVTIFGAFGVAKLLGEAIALSYTHIAIIVVACGAVRGLLRYFEQYLNHFIAFKLLATLRDKIFKALRVLAPAKLETKQKGSIISMLTSDIETLEVFYAHTISPIFIAILSSVAVVLFTGLYTSWYIALVAIIGYVLIGLILPIINGRILKKPGVEYRREFADFNGYYLDSIKGVKDIVLNNAQDTRREEVNNRSSKMLEQTHKLNKRSAFTGGVTQLFVSLFIVAVLAVGCILYINDSISIGKMIIGVVAVFSSFGPVIALSALPSSLNQTFAAGNRVLDLLAEEPEVKEITNGKDISFDSLKVDNLGFAYEEKEQVLNDIAFSAKKGEIIAIVGESGCGKSTLLKLLLRFWKKDKGSINFNDIDIDNINTNSLLDNVTMVSQTTYLFDESIKDNLKIAKLDATDAEIEEACKKASIHQFITSLPDGYDTQVGALGDRLSAGEKQRIGVARAFLHDSPVILLDEPTSNVDSLNEGIILKALKDIKKDKTIILVSHRESTTAIADRVYKMDKGKFVNAK